MQGQDVFGCKINIEKYWGRGPLKADKESTSSGFNSMMPTNQANRIPRGNMHNAYSMDGLHSRNLARGQFFQDDAANGLPPINMPAAGYRNQPNQNRLQHTRMKKAASAKSMGGEQIDYSNIYLPFKSMFLPYSPSTHSSDCYH